MMTGTRQAQFLDLAGEHKRIQPSSTSWEEKHAPLDVDHDNEDMSIALDALIFTTGWIHVLLAPYNKVEESFNLHATHDVLMYGIGIENLYNVRLRVSTDDD